jgi:preprotein translocase subunit SecE
VTEDIKVQAPDTSDKAKLTVAVLLVLAGIAGFYWLGNQAHTAWMRWLAVAAGLVLAALVVAYSRYGTALKQFILDSRVELRKIVWPGRQETGMTTLVVFVFVIVSGVFFWLLDLVLAWATRAFTGQGS